MVSRSVTADDPPCDDYPEFRCQYFRITPPIDGRLDVAMTATLRAAVVAGAELIPPDPVIVTRRPEGGVPGRNE
jgi:hypothetical protein